MERGLVRLRSAGFSPESAIDVGAYRGEWTLLCKAVFPHAGVLMVEAPPHLEPSLRDLARGLADVHARVVLLGARACESVPFFLDQTGSRVATGDESGSLPTLLLPMSTLEDVATEAGFSTPQLLKLDVQGHELDVLRGAQRLLRSVEVVIMKVNLLPILPGAPLVDDVVAFMREQGYQLYDVCGFIERSLDRAPWQMDVVFVRRDSALVASSSWA
jgi:FkbM family methyltransferase